MGKEKTGRPPMFTTPKDLQEKIDQYFIDGVKKKTVLVGKPPNQMPLTLEVPTITGLCIYCGFESRQSFYAYELKSEFSYTIKRARLFIENNYEEMLQAGNTVGAIFALKNFGWIDKQEIDHTTQGEKLQSFEIGGKHIHF
jgi:hypothetical protein